MLKLEWIAAGMIVWLVVWGIITFLPLEILVNKYLYETFFILTMIMLGVFCNMLKNSRCEFADQCADCLEDGYGNWHECDRYHFLKEDGMAPRVFKIWTAQYRYDGPDRLDITVKGQNSIGKWFAPTWEMVRGLKAGRLSWEEYVEQYNNLIVSRITSMRTRAVLAEAVTEIISREEVTLVCFCKSPENCHRRLLAKFLVNYINNNQEAEYIGEREI